jgi:hypothetical protein
MNHLNTTTDIIIEKGVVEIFNQTDNEIVHHELDNFLSNQTDNQIKFVKIYKCSQKVIQETLKSFEGRSIKTLKLVSFWIDKELTQKLSRININEVDFEDFVVDIQNFGFLGKVKKATFTFYKRNISGLDQILDSIDLIGNKHTLFEFNLGVNLNSCYETWAESTSNVLGVVDKLIKHKSQITILDIDYETIEDIILKKLVDFVKDNQTIRILNIPTLFSPHNLLMKLLNAIRSAPNLEMFLTNCIYFDREILETIAKIVESNKKIWHCVGDKDDCLSKYLQHEGEFEKFIHNQLSENENGSVTNYYKCK